MLAADERAELYEFDERVALEDIELRVDELEEAVERVCVERVAVVFAERVAVVVERVALVLVERAVIPVERVAVAVERVVVALASLLVERPATLVERVLVDAERDIVVRSAPAVRVVASERVPPLTAAVRVVRTLFVARISRAFVIVALRRLNELSGWATA